MEELISELLEKGIFLSKVGEKLNVEFNGDAISEELLDKIRSNKERLLSYLDDNESKNTYREIQQVKKADCYEMSSAQKRIWVLCQFEEVSKVYNMPNSILLNGDYNIENFKKAIHATVERHEILRTIFKPDETNEVKQWIIEKDEFPFEIDVLDFSNRPKEDVEAFIRTDSYLPFDLESGPLLRASMIKVAEQEYIFYNNMHHIISDGWSKDIMSRDVLAFYQAFQEGTPVQLPELRIQYKDYSAWQQSQLKNGDFDVARSFWLNSLSGTLPVLRLPSTKERPRVRTYSGQSLTTFISDTSTERLRKYSLANGGTLFMGLLAVWNVLKYRYSGQEDLIIGSVVAGRDHADLEDQIGYYLNTLSLRNQIDPEETFAQFFERLVQNTYDAFSHQSYPFDRLVEELDVRRDESRSAVFDVIFALQNTSKETEDYFIGTSDLTEIRPNGAVLEKFDMTVLFKEVGNYLSFEVNYNSDSYDHELMEGLMKHFKSLVDALMNDPLKRLGQVDFLSEQERVKLIQDRNTSEITELSEETLLDLFNQQVQSTPEAIALTLGDSSFTYAELNGKSDELARCLVNEYNVKPNDRVGIFMDRSEWLVISTLAVLKAGATYVPIDTKTTVERQSFIISDSEPKLLLILSESMFDILEFDVEAFSVDIQLSDWVDANQDLEVRLEPVVPAQTAYIIYTSGSTGTPKGVEVSHGNVHNYLSWAIKTYLVEERDVQNHFGLYSSPSFDLTITSLFLPLISGAKLHIYPAEMEIAELLREYFDSSTSMDIIKLTPAHIQVLEHLDIHSTNVKTAIVGGEELRPHHVQILKRLNAKMRVFNEYGPTECTVGCTVCEVENERSITIGKPINNTQAYIVNEFGSLQPEGVIGELVIGGRGVAKGYLNQSDQTNDRFISPAFLEEGERVYKTGDLARWLPNGELAYFGRNDDQVKIRGHRVELGEISNKIALNEFVESATLKIFEQEEDNKTLVAYYIPDSKTAYSLNQSLHHAKDQLPDRMKLYELPNGMLMYAYNKTELHFVFEEIFEHDVYLKHGIQIPDNACVFDVGANDGMFSLYAHLAANDVKVHAFEPLPPTFELLKHNTELYEGDYTVHKIGLSQKEETATFSYFPNATVLSTRYQQENEIAEIVKKFIKNANDTATEKLKDEQLDTLLGERLVHEEYECKLKRLSQVIAEENIEKIDLLKVDVEKSELDVLEGIDQEDWKKIQQIVIEVHDDENNRLAHIKGLLEDHDYHVIVHQSDDAQGTNLYDLYARKRTLIEAESKSVQQSIRSASCKSAKDIEQEIRSFLEAQLPDYMIPNQFIPLANFPLTKNGKIDKDQLPNPFDASSHSERNYLAPESQLEKDLVLIWKEVLQKEQVGMEDDFFMLGGHSLKAIRLINEYQKSFDVKLSINDLFTNTTVKSHVSLVQSAKTEDFAEIAPLDEAQLEEGRKSGFMISDAQRRLWILSQFEESSIAYNVSGTVQLVDSIDLIALKKATRSVVGRHEILRTVFRMSHQDDDAGEVRQWIIPIEEFNFSIDYHDFIGTADEAFAYIERDSLLPFDLENGPLIRVAILQLKSDEFLLYYNMHHIISDGWSMEVLTNDTMAMYKEFHEGIDSGLKPLAIQYKEYAQWKLEELQKGTFDEHKQFWLENLSGELPTIDLSRIKKRPRIKTYNGRTLGMFLSKELTAQLNSYALENGGTLFMLLSTSLNALLSRYTGQNDIIIGSPVAGRSHADLENQIGFYVNTLALRNDVFPSDSFADLFERVKKNTLSAYQYQEYPFDRLVDELNLPVDTGRHPVFDIMLVMQNNRENDATFTLQNQTNNEVFEIGTQTSKFDLLIAAEEYGDHIALSFEYNTDVYDSATIERFAKHFNRITESLVTEITKPIHSINFLLESEHERLTQSLNDTNIPYAGNTVISLFEEQVSRTPDATAVVFNGESLTYNQLNEWSNALANALRDDFGVNVPKESEIGTKTHTVGVMLHRSLESVVAMIGVMKSSACYVPVDHDYPTERVQYMAQDASFDLVVGEQHLIEKHGLESKTIVSIANYDPRSNDSVNVKNVKIELKPAHWAAIYYTSGSTGKPKGVIQTHRMIRNLTQWDMHESGLGSGLRHLQYASFGFDASIHDVYSVLCRAGSLYVVSEDRLLDYPALLQEIGEYQIETMFMPFSALNAFLMQVDLNQVESHCLKHIISTAEQLYVNEQMKNFLEQNPEVKLHNRYGPSETHVVTSCWMSASEGYIVDRPSIGKPISNTQVYVLDEHENLLPEGTIGEICIAGDNVGAGYLNLPELTKQKFVENPFEKGGRMYKTGDLGYWTPDGNIELIGRGDDQVKIRGYRIELGEVEHALKQNDVIDEAVVLARKNTTDETELMAYVTSETELSVARINEKLKKILPHFMIPVHYIQLNEFPLTSNGKVDKRSLSDHENEGLLGGAEYQEPRNETEEKLVKIWQEVLQKERIGIKDDFFLLGGHSLKVVKLINHINREFNVAYDLRMIYSESTIEQIAQKIKTDQYYSSTSIDEEDDYESITI